MTAHNLHRYVLITCLLASLAIAVPTVSAHQTAATASTEATGTDAVDEAATHRGKPYQYGATGPDRFDCSGFTQFVFNQGGMSLPRTTSQQYAATTAVDRDAKRAGDLIFPRSNGRITHVGIYAGEDRMWISPKTGDVVKLQTIYTSDYAVRRV